jgi:hypothetical protein
LSPVWDELLLFEEILVYGRREDIKANPPAVIIEIYDQDKVNKKCLLTLTRIIFIFWITLDIF